MTSRQVADRLRSERVNGLDEEVEVDTALWAPRSCLRVSRRSESGIKISLKGSTASSSDDRSDRRRFCFLFLSAILRAM